MFYDFRHLSSRRRIATPLHAHDSVDHHHSYSRKVTLLNAVEQMLPGRVLRFIHEDEIRRTTSADQATVKVSFARSIAGREAYCDLGWYFAKRRKHGDHPQFAKWLHP